MLTRSTTRGNVTYLDHEPDEIPNAPVQNRPRQPGANMPSAANYSQFEGEAPPLSLDRAPDDVDHYYSHFSCPVCYLWRANGESRAVRGCGHVVCVGCWDEWARTNGRGPPNNRLTSCPVCRTEVNHGDTREVDFRATRFNSASEVARRLTERIKELRQSNDNLLALFNELRADVALLENQRQKLIEFQGELTAVAAGIESMVIEE